VLTSLIHRALDKVGMPKDLVYLISPKEDWQKVLLNAHGLVDVIIPRGGAGLIKWVRENSRIPTIETGAGVCHTFVDGNVDVVKASKIIINAKTQRPSVCNALDTLVIHKKALMLVMEKAISGLAASNVVILADIESYKALKNIYPKNLLQKAKRGDFGHEFLSLKMSIKTVKSFEQGLEFVKENTSGHSEAILSRDSKHIKQFLNEVDAAVVYANASTRFTDGEEFGMGAEVGISTQKLHARGPMGLEALTSYKWIGKGDWIIRK
jgi:glutamate-5-semialdehyde dehydrogenase